MENVLEPQNPQNHRVAKFTCLYKWYIYHINIYHNLKVEKIVTVPPQTLTPGKKKTPKCLKDPKGKGLWCKIHEKVLLCQRASKQVICPHGKRSHSWLEDPRFQQETDTSSIRVQVPACYVRLRGQSDSN